VDSRPGVPVFNRIIDLKDTWAKPADKPEPRRLEKKPLTEKPASTKKSRAEARRSIRAATPGLEERFRRYQEQLHLSAEDADLLTTDLGMARYFEAAIASQSEAKSVAKWLLNDLVGLIGDGSFDALPLSGADFGRFVGLVDSGRITQGAGKTLLARLAKSGGDPEQLVQKLGLERLSNANAIEAAVRKVLAEHPDEALRYRAGEKKLFGVLLGAVMRQTQGAADVSTVRDILNQMLA
jgi:Asp-tRNA(Asn)/Glu-tRNA(Gln) amidotransferase B subunit